MLLYVLDVVLLLMELAVGVDHLTCWSRSLYHLISVSDLLVSVSDAVSCRSCDVM